MKCNSIFFCMLLAICANNFTYVKAQVNVSDSLALVDLYDSTNGPGWDNHTNWLTTSPVSTWAGITLTGDRVTTVGLSFNNLQGPLPSSIGNLTALQYLVLDFNKLTGTIPSSIGNLTNLLWLELYTNEFTGTVPPSFTNLINLKWLQLQFNQLSGTIPLTVCNIPTLQVLQLDDNQFSGPIPEAIGRLTNMVILDLSDNQLTGGIPDSLRNLSLMLELDLFGNQLSGRIPAFIGSLNVQTLSLYNNQLSGPIPPEIGNLHSATFIDLSTNRLSGNVPATIKNLSGLGTLHLSGNELTISKNVGFDPSWFPYLREIDFRTNKFNFNGVEAIAGNFPYKFTYSPQAHIKMHQHGTSLAVSAGGTLSNNTYTWFEIGKAGNTVITGDSTFQPTESGRYFARVKNAIATRLTLSTDTIVYDMAMAAAGNVNAVSKTASMALVIYPNPVKDLLHVQLNQGAIITILDATGRVMITKQLSGSTIVSTALFANGLYYCKNNNTGEIKQFEVMH